jgi:hypothetical protein
MGITRISSCIGLPALQLPIHTVRFFNYVEHTQNAFCSSFCLLSIHLWTYNPRTDERIFMTFNVKSFVKICQHMPVSLKSDDAGHITRRSSIFAAILNETR